MRVIYLFTLTLLLLIGLSGRAQDNSYIDERENWDVIIDQFEDMLARSQKLLGELNAFVDKGLARFRLNSRKVEKRASELRFLLWEQSSNDVFGMALYCKQIDDLKQMYDRRVSQLERYSNMAQHDLKRSLILAESLRRTDLHDLQTTSVKKLNACQQGLDTYIKTMRSYCEQFDIEITQAHQLQKKLDELSAHADSRREEMMNRVIFHPNTGLRQTLPLARIMLSFWINDVSCWLAVQTPDDPVFWRNFLLLLLLVGMPLFLLGPAIFRRLVKVAIFPEKFTKSRTFLIAWGMIVFAILCLSTQLMLGEVEFTSFRRLGQFLLACAMLLLALSVRLDRKSMRAAILLHLPLVAQHGAGILLCTLLVPHQPLILLVPLISLPVIVATVWLLLIRRYSVFDTILAWLTAFFSAVIMVLALSGRSYIAFTMMLVWFMVVAGLQCGTAATQLIRNYTNANINKRIMTCLVLSLFSPLLWITLIGSLIYWTAGLYNAQNMLTKILTADLASCRNIIEVNLFDIMLAVVSALLLHFALRTGHHLIDIIYGKEAERGLVLTFATLGTYIAWAMFAIFVLILFKVHYSSILVVLGGMSMGVGFGLKEMVENFISGIILLAGKQLRPGDVIEFNGTWGRVRKVSVRATVVDTEENAVITFPNTEVLSKDFRNWTLNHSIMRREIKLGVAYGSDVPKILNLLKDVVNSHRNVLKSPSPTVYFTDFADSSLTFSVRFWVNISTRSQTSSELRQEIARVFNENGIVLAFPQLDVHLDQPVRLVSVPMPEPSITCHKESAP